MHALQVLQVFPDTSDDPGFVPGICVAGALLQDGLNGREVAPVSQDQFKPERTCQVHEARQPEVDVPGLNLRDTRLICPGGVCQFALTQALTFARSLERGAHFFQCIAHDDFSIIIIQFDV